ncbi:hypothetical protein EYF80_006093 [Liparis tanakae]|uniref:Uncharacterized protein n=1 Tax=Liparis tanakae TaxID=230148 RepID=A0A4Z2IZS9_9TELE|nr:hypothetical protein EYF80_006093 [Liparis tanakae]
MAVSSALRCQAELSAASRTGFSLRDPRGSASSLLETTALCSRKQHQEYKKSLPLQAQHGLNHSDVGVNGWGMGIEKPEQKGSSIE